MIMEEVMLLMEKVQENQKKRRDLTCCDKGGYREQQRQSDVSPAMPVV